MNLKNMDCMEGLKSFKDNEFDLAIVDPPYGIKNDGGETGKNWAYYDKKEWDSSIPTKEYFDELFRVSKNQIIWGGNYMVEFLKPSMGWIFWDKGQKLTMSDGELAFSSFDRALRSIVLNRVEIRKNTIPFHPTQKPVQLYKWLLTNYAKKGDKILDTHLGSGSIAIACHDLGFDLTGFELDKDYFKAMQKRIEEHQLQQTLF